MIRPIKRIAVMGTGTMGIGIAAHAANCGYEVLFLDMPAQEGDKDEIERLIEQRNAARTSKDWVLADEIRDRLAAMGIQIQDGPDGTEWRVD